MGTLFVELKIAVAVVAGLVAVIGLFVGWMNWTGDSERYLPPDNLDDEFDRVLFEKRVEEARAWSEYQRRKRETKLFSKQKGKHGRNTI